jgi:hypothetical protein
MKGDEMTRERFRFGVVVLGLVAQIVGGVVLFGLVPQAVFVDIGGDDLARLCLRLAVYSNLSMALVIALALFYAPRPQLLRWLAAGGALYNLLAGLDGLRTALGFTGVNLTEPIFGPAIVHCFMFVVLATAALIPEQQSLKSQ